MKYSLSPYAILLLSLLLFGNCQKDTNAPTPSDPSNQNPTVIESVRIGFYNMENLFDTIDDPENSQDDEFLPTSNKQWTPTRYQRKLNNMASVISSLAFPALMGLAEVENEKVLEDLVKNESLSITPYAWIHEDSPDFRGIDVALLYQPSIFTPLSYEAIEVSLPASVSNFSTTRDILMVKGLLGEEEIYLFINHWPSRSGGVEQTEGKRKFAATILKEKIFTIRQTQPSAQFILMGDFNDEPFDESVLTILETQTNKINIIESQLYNCSAAAALAGKGSLNFRGNWQMFDQIIVSGQLLDGNGPFQVEDFEVFEEAFLFFEHPENGPIPDRTYGGDNYFGGFSDHLPVFIDLNRI